MTGRTRFGPNIIDTEQLYDACIEHAKLADDAVETHNIKNLNVTSSKLAEGILTTGTRIRVAYAEVPCTADATVPIGTIEGGSMITDVIVATSTAINGSGTEDIGDGDDHDGLLATANITKTANAISGEDPATRGVYLWVPGAYTGGSLSAGSQTKTASNWTVIDKDTGTELSHDKLPFTQTKTAGDWTVTQGTLTAAAITTWGHPRRKWVVDDTIYNAYIAKGSNTTGVIRVYIFYERGVMSG